MDIFVDNNKTKLSIPLMLFHCGREKCKPSHSFGPAIRPHYLFHFILGGRGTYYINGESFHLVKGQGFLIPPGVTTLYAADEKDPWEYCWIGFDGFDAKTILQRCGFINKNLIYTDQSKGNLKMCLLNLIDTFMEGKGNEYTGLGQLYLCFSHMCAPTINSSKLHYESHLEKALDYIQNNYTYDIRISDLAKFIGIDRTYLYKIFMTYKNVSPLQYLIDYRLNIAKKLLLETELSVTEIVYSCGFKDTPSFYKHFKKQLNVTPLQYRTNKDHFWTNERNNL